MLICPHSGIGNQIGNYVFAQYLTSLGINVKFLFSHDENIDRAFVLDKFNTNLPEAEKEDIEKFLKNSVEISLYPKLCYNLLFRKRTYFNSLYKILQRIRLEHGIYPYKTPKLMAKVVSYKDILETLAKGENLPKNTAVCDCYSPIEEFNTPSFREKIKTHFVLKEKFDDKNEEAHRKISGAKNSVGVHIRRGDYIGLKIPVVKREFILDKMKTLAGKFSDAKFFIFSDTINWARENLSNTGFDVEFVDINDEAHGYLDFVLFNNCRHRIYSASSFSNWTAYLNPHNDSIEFNPESKDLVVE